MTDGGYDLLWKFAAAVGGAFVSMALPMHQALKWGSKLVNFVGGILCAMFLAPPILKYFRPDLVDDLETVVGFCFFVGASAMALLPYALSKARKLLGDGG